MDGRWNGWNEGIWNGINNGGMDGGMEWNGNGSGMESMETDELI